MKWISEGFARIFAALYGQHAAGTMRSTASCGS